MTTAPIAPARVAPTSATPATATATSPLIGDDGAGIFLRGPIANIDAVTSSRIALVIPHTEHSHTQIGGLGYAKKVGTLRQAVDAAFIGAQSSARSYFPGVTFSTVQAVFENPSDGAFYVQPLTSDGGPFTINVANGSGKAFKEHVDVTALNPLLRAIVDSRTSIEFSPEQSKRSFDRTGRFQEISIGGV